ncbi:putative dual-specificity RNA methyltransferase RlmN [Arachis hypogaea]|nr:putative dual-specificity RNA methyltransferase RlmN [Arachis hypogaea]
MGSIMKSSMPTNRYLVSYLNVVNLIPFNSIGMLSQFKPTTEQKVWAFHKILRGMYNIQTKIRKQMGQDISGACGQLVVNVPDKSLGNAEPLTIIEDLFI